MKPYESIFMKLQRLNNNIPDDRESSMMLNDNHRVLNGDIIETINQFGVTEERMN